MPRTLTVIAAVLVLRLGVLAVRAFLPLGFPDVWRQMDTLGVSMRYWSRWTIETHPTHCLLPAILNSGDTQGIMAMEFPILNLVTAPFFAWGPHRGKAMAILFLTFLGFALTWVNSRLWSEKREAMLLIPVFSFGAYWSGKFMPDFLSMVLVLISVGMVWGRESQRFTSLAAGFLATLGLLMKPTSVVVFLLLLIHKDFKEKIRKAWPWILFSCVSAAGYHQFGARVISRFQELPASFAVGMRPLFPSIQSFFANINQLPALLFYRPLVPGGVVLVALVAFRKAWKTRKLRINRLWVVVVLQTLVIAGLAGSHVYVHAYYFIGLTPTFCLIFHEAWEGAWEEAWKEVGPKWLKLAFLVVFVFPILELSAMDLKTLYRRPQESIWTLDGQCRSLIEKNPRFPWGKGEAFRSSPESAPMLGLCFGERQGSQKADFGFFWREQGLPPGCRETDSTLDLILARCE